MMIQQKRWDEWSSEIKTKLLVLTGGSNGTMEAMPYVRPLMTFVAFDKHLVTGYEPIGWAMVDLDGFIFELYVDPTHRGKGAGRMLADGATMFCVMAGKKAAFFPGYSNSAATAIAMRFADRLEIDNHELGKSMIVDCMNYRKARGRYYCTDYECADGGSSEMAA